MGSIVEPPPTVVEELGDGITLEMLEIPGGEFWMGSPEGERGSYSDERPRYEVIVSPFLMGKYPVTQAQWRAVCEAVPSASASLPIVERDLNSDPSNFKGDDRPVEQVSWYDVLEFCKRLSKLTGRDYRLPSEAEWEYACRAVTSDQLSAKSEESIQNLKSKIQNPTYPPFHFGETITPDLANYAESARGRTTPVGRFQVANAFGLYDMHGNVYEWCADHWHDSYEGAPTDGSSWLTDNENQQRMLRGGGWGDDSGSCRCANRDCYSPEDRLNYIGLVRFVLSK